VHAESHAGKSHCLLEAPVLSGLIAVPRYFLGANRLRTIVLWHAGNQGVTLEGGGELLLLASKAQEEGRAGQPGLALPKTPDHSQPKKV
jgi:hypothetical protein